ncbi:hypothetical protein PF011_g15404 [Phytophthora fragariae]|uniref:Uncharacterized protein n=1 Tax=Phytophthora fragariae TaxID=53985 RepID=A0A6A3JWI7_9STRA|nr:hypothetical protein PF011_g15404 [Phytophthora fragariae]
MYWSINCDRYETDHEMDLPQQKAMEQQQKETQQKPMSRTSDKYDQLFQSGRVVEDPKFEEDV